MKARNQTFTEQSLMQARHSLQTQNLPRITKCLKILSQQQIWWRPHPTSNGVGNMVLHLAGNVRQWIISGLGEEPDRRERDKEFSELGPISRRSLIQQIEGTVDEACRVLARLSWHDLEHERRIQGFRVTGIDALTHVTEHFAYHTG